MADFSKIDAVLESFLSALGEMSAKNAGTCELNKNSYVAEKGSKYIRIVAVGHSQRFSYCFLDAEGNIYKSASWKAPAKHIRGNILNDANYSIGKALGPYGAAYMR
jgi:hypothetical protein